MSNVKFDEHIDNTINKVNRIIGLIKRKFKFIDIDLFLWQAILLLSPDEVGGI